MIRNLHADRVFRPLLRELAHPCIPKCSVSDSADTCSPGVLTRFAVTIRDTFERPLIRDQCLSQLNIKVLRVGGPAAFRTEPPVIKGNRYEFAFALQNTGLHVISVRLRADVLDWFAIKCVPKNEEVKSDLKQAVASLPPLAASLVPLALPAGLAQVPVATT